VAIKDFIIRGVFQDSITAGLNSASAAIKGLTASLARVAPAAKTASAALNVFSNKAAMINGINRTTGAINANTAAIVRNGRAAKAANAAGAGIAIAGGAPPRGRPPRMPKAAASPKYWTQMQMSMAALGQKGYALGRGGPATLATLVPAYGAYKAVKAYGDMEKSMATVRRAIDTDARRFSKEDTKLLGQELERIGIPLSMNGPTVAGIAEKLALGGINDPEALKMLTKTTAQGASIWEGVDADMVGDNIAKMLSLYQKGVTDPEKLNTAARKFIATTDYFADSTPGVDAKGLVTAFERSMASGKALGITPESLMAVTAGWLQNAEKSGERIGTRERTGFMDMMGWLAGNDAVTGKKRAQLGEVVGGEAGKAINEAVITDPMLGLAMFVSTMKKRGLREADKQIRRVFKDERGGYLMPLVSGAEDVVDKLMITDKSVREFALKEAEELERTAKAGRSGNAQRAEAWRLRQKVKGAEKAVAANRIEQQVDLAFDTMNDAFTRLGLRLASMAKVVAANTVVPGLTTVASDLEKALSMERTTAPVKPHPSLPKGRPMPSVTTGFEWLSVPHFRWGQPGAKIGHGIGLHQLPPAEEVPTNTLGETDLGGGGSRIRGGRRYKGRTAAINRRDGMGFYNFPKAPGAAPPVPLMGTPAQPPIQFHDWDTQPAAPPTVVPGPPQTVTVPFTASAGGTPGHVEVSVKVTQNPNIVVQGAGGGAGSHGDAPNGVTTPTK
jgi:hypothetical protein